MRGWDYCTTDRRRRWDYGLRWRSRKTADFVQLTTSTPRYPLELAYIRDEVLKLANGNAEDRKIEQLIAVSTALAEDRTKRAIPPQEWQLIVDGFPVEYFELPRPPLIEVTGFDYLDADGATQSLALSPADFRIVPAGAYTKARVYPAYGSSWPSALAYGEAVTLTYVAGYETADAVPELIRAGMELVIGELYKGRSLSVTSLVNNTKAVLDLDHFFRPVY